MSNIGDLRIWWIPQVPGKPFYVYVKNLDEAKLVSDTLARYDQFQLDQYVKPDYSNAGGLEFYDSDDEWTDWYSDDGDDFDEWISQQEETG